MKPKLLIKVGRGGYVEKLHYGFVLVVDGGGNTVLRIGDDEGAIFPFRSSAKPLQASMVIDSDAYKHFALTDEELAMICSSHVGSATHIRIVGGILAKAGLTVDNLQCGAHAPLDKEEAERLIRAYEAPSSPYNNCSGKHAGMLLSCAKEGWDVKTYLQTDHPLQKAIMENIKTLCELENLPPTVSDGCSAPVPVLPLKNMGAGYINLLMDDKYAPIRDAMTQSPYVAGGKGRLDSEIMNAGCGTLVAKVGADGLCVVMNIPEKKALVVKITDSDVKARSIVVIESLLRLGWLTESMIAASEGLKSLNDREIKNLRSAIAGEIKAVFN